MYAIELIEKFPIQRFKLVIDGFYSFNPLQYLVIRSLGGAGMPIDIYLPNNQSEYLHKERVNVKIRSKTLENLHKKEVNVKIRRQNHGVTAQREG